MDDFQPPSTASQLEGSLELAIDRLTRVVPTSETKRLLIEGRRLRSLLANWRSIPPSQDVRREMLARIMDLSAAAAEAAPATSFVPASAKAPLQGPAMLTAITQPSVVAVTPPGVAPRALIAPGIAVLRPDGLDAEELEGVPGVEIKFLPSPGPGCLRCAVVKMFPGAQLPARDLPGGEALYVVEGVARIGSLDVIPGQICYAEPETVHLPISTIAGCLLFVVAPDEGEESGT